MRIEIFSENEGARVFLLDRPKLLIGSNENCDIVVKVRGISRKHLAILKEGDDFYVVDQGSTNGSYINEERLVPGRKVEFTTFFPVRLGTDVLITLVSDEDASSLTSFQTSSKETKPKLSSGSFSTGTSTKPVNLTSKNKKVSAISKKPASKGKTRSENERSGMKMLFILCLAALGSLYYFKYLKPETQVPEVVIAPASDIQEVKPTQDPPPRFELVDEVALVPLEKFPLLALDMKCTNDLEKYLCDKLAINGLKDSGVIQVGTMLVGLIDGQKYYLKARDLLPSLVSIHQKLNQQELKDYQDSLKLTAILLFIQEALPKDLNLELLKEKNITFAFQFQPLDPKKPGERSNGQTEKEAAEKKEFFAAAITFKSLIELQKTIEPHHFKQAKQTGARALFFFKDYFRIY